MAQPQGYVDPAFPKHVCLLHKALYGLKQAPKAWFERFTSQLLHIGFCASAADCNLFILRHGSSIVFLLLYVDDIIITCNKSSFFSSVIKLLRVDFDFKDLGLLITFLDCKLITLLLDYLFIKPSMHLISLRRKPKHANEFAAASMAAPHVRPHRTLVRHPPSRVGAS